MYVGAEVLSMDKVFHCVKYFELIMPFSPDTIVLSAKEAF